MSFEFDIHHSESAVSFLVHALRNTTAPTARDPRNSCTVATGYQMRKTLLHFMQRTIGLVAGWQILLIRRFKLHSTIQYFICSTRITDLADAADGWDVKHEKGLADWLLCKED